jgi:hypothetical protein
MMKHLKLIFAGTMLTVAFSVPVYADCIPGDTQSPPCTGATQPAPGTESNVPPSASSNSTESVVTELAIELIEELLLYV